jgi:PAS domain S-box-containing protein
VLVIDERGTIQWVNPAVLQIFGYSTEEMIGSNVKMLMPEPYHSEHDGYLAHYVKGGLPKILGVGQREVSGKHKGGTVFPLDLGVTEMRIDGRRQFVGVVRDTTDRVAAAEQLRKNAERLQIYHDHQEAESQLAQKIVFRQMQRRGLNDACVRHWVSPAANFSGDIVAATRAPGGELYVLLADATGHGLGAAICTLPVLSVFDSMAEMGVALSWIVYEVNRQLCSTLPVGYFVAATMLCIDPAKGVAEVWVGGTPELLLIDASGGLKCTLVSRSLPLGIDLLEREGIETERVTVAASDQFVLFSDGLIEAANNQDIAFGLEQMLAALRSAPSTGRVDAVRTALAAHLGDCLPHDDVSLLLVECDHAG